MSSQLKPAVNERDHLQGSASAPIEIVEYGDFQCPHCGAAYPVIKKMQEVFGNQIKFIFRNFPLSESHQYAKIAALAAEAAGLQGKYWEMHDAIYENQDQLNDDLLYELAQTLGLDEQQFEKDVQSPELNEKVEADFEGGMRSGVSGTPSFFVNGQKFDGGAEDLYNMLKDSAE